MNSQLTKTAWIFLTLFASAAFSADIDELKLNAEKGDASAQYELAMAYDQGVGITKDQAEAARWCLKAAEQGLAQAQNCIGSMYQYGEGVLQDEAAAIGWYEKAVAQGYGEAFTNLGYMYDLGKGVPQNRLKAIELYRKGAEQGSLNAMLNLGISYWKGSGVAADPAEAFMWLDLARLYTQRSNNMQLKWRVRGALDELQKEMTKAQVKEGRRRTTEWDATHRPK